MVSEEIVNAWEKGCGEPPWS